MRIRSVCLILLLSLIAWSPASAGPVTGQPVTTTGDVSPTTNGAESDESRAASFAASMLFDAAGLPMLRLSAPTYLHLDPRAKLRARASDQGQGDGGGGGNIFPSAASSVGGNVGIEVPTNFTDKPLIPNLVIPQRIPEPATLLLLAPGVALALRRRARSRQAAR